MRGGGGFRTRGNLDSVSEDSESLSAEDNVKVGAVRSPQCAMLVRRAAVKWGALLSALCCVNY